MEVKVTKEMVYAFCNAVSDASITEQEFNEVEIGLKAAICNLNMPSDLEIVQKALASLKGSIEIDRHGKWWVYLHNLNQSIESDYNGTDIKALLTWAKQQIGVE